MIGVHNIKKNLPQIHPHIRPFTHNPRYTRTPNTYRTQCKPRSPTSHTTHVTHAPQIPIEHSVNPDHPKPPKYI